MDGSLRAPWRWEALLVESAVIGGPRSLGHASRRARATSTASGSTELAADEPEAPRVAAVSRDLEQLGHLRGICAADHRAAGCLANVGVAVGRLARSTRAPGATRAATSRRASCACSRSSTDGRRRAGRDRRGAEGADRAAAHARGRAADAAASAASLSARPTQARGRTFRVVFVPGLAERIFPQKLREDPLLLDDVRAALGVGLPATRRRARATSACSCGWRSAPRPSGCTCRTRDWTSTSRARACRRSTRST